MAGSTEKPNNVPNQRITQGTYGVQDKGKQFVGQTGGQTVNGLQLIEQLSGNLKSNGSTK